MLRRIVSLVVLVAASLASTPARHAEAASNRLFQRRWFDTCSAPTTAQMLAWNVSPYYGLGIYVGGVHRACSQPNLTPAWRTYVLTHGWGLMPIWVGPQLPCSGYANRFSYDPATAYGQGSSEAVGAYGATSALGFPSDLALVYDIEGTSNPITSPCIAAVRSFIQGWIDYLKAAPPQTPGYYGSTCNPSLDNFATIARPPDFVWGANQNGNPSTSTFSCVQPYYWTTSQRHKQYVGTHAETWGGVTLSIDTDCANGPMYTIEWGTDTSCL